jgi:hypothetical protein
MNKEGTATMSNTLASSASNMTTMLVGFIGDLRTRAQAIIERLGTLSEQETLADKEAEMADKVAILQRECDGKIKVMEDQMATLAQAMGEIRKTYEGQIADVRASYGEQLSALRAVVVGPEDADALREELKSIKNQVNLFEASILTVSPGYVATSLDFDAALVEHKAPKAEGLGKTPASAAKEDFLDENYVSVAESKADKKRPAFSKVTSQKRVQAEPNPVKPEKPDSRQLTIGEAIEKAFFTSEKKEMKLAEITALIKRMGIPCNPREVAGTIKKKKDEGRVAHNEESHTWTLVTRKSQAVAV